jgi:hypothetical protein
MSYPWPADVLAFAAKHQVGQYLEPLLEATRRLFPTGQVKIFFERDAEFPDEQYIVFEVSAPSTDVPEYPAACRKWGAETFRILPARLHAWFVFSLDRPLNALTGPTTGPR